MLLRTIAFASLALLWAAPGQAGVLYVSANGPGTTCTNTSPCSFLETAMQVARVGDTIVCLSPPNGAGLVIDKSITIDCSGARAPVITGGNPNNTPGGPFLSVFINVPASASDPLATVRLRGLSIDAFLTGAPNPLGDRGIDIQAATAVYIEDCVISNMRQQGIFDHRTGGQTKLFIKDSFISGSKGAGIVAAAAAVGIVVLDNVRSENNAYGIAAAAGNNVSISHSVLSGNSSAGVEADAGAQIILDGSTITHNNIGVQSASSVRLSNNNIGFNNTAISGSSGTFGNNRFSGNGSIGTAPTALGGASSDLGQQ